ncbi:hypothetical protein D3C74_159970 [compost metagenome]
MQSKTRRDLIGLKGTITRKIEVLNAKEFEDGTVLVYINDGVSNPDWVGLNEVTLESEVKKDA